MENRGAAVAPSLVFVFGFGAVDGYTRSSVHFQRFGDSLATGYAEMVFLITVVMQNQHPVGVVAHEFMNAIHAIRAITTVLSCEFLNEMFLWIRLQNRFAGSVRVTRGEHQCT